MFAPFRTIYSEANDVIALADEFLSEGSFTSEGLSYAGLSGQTDGGQPGPSGGPASSGSE